MIRPALFIARKDLQYLFRLRESWLWAFVMPVVFFYFIGTITGGFARPAAERRDPIGILFPADAGVLADQIAARLERLGYRPVKVADEAALARFERRLIVPAGFSAAVLQGRPMKVKFSRTGGGMNADYDEVRINRAVYGVLADLILLRSRGTPASAPALAALQSEPRPLTLAVQAAGKRREPPRGFEQAVPGVMVQFTLFVLFTSGAVTLTLERQSGRLRRLASAPLPRGAAVFGKWLSRFVMGLIQIAFAMAAGTLLFKVRWGPELPSIGAVLALYAALAATLGMLLGNFGQTRGQVVGIGVISTNIMAALGGCWWPIEITPAWAQKLAFVFPTGWAMDALHKLMSFGEGPAAVAPHMAVTAAAALAGGWILARNFRFQ